MKILKANKIIKIIFVVTAIAAAALVLVWKFAPPSIVRTFGNAGPAKILCQYPVKVSGDAMMPTFTNGQTIMLSKCISDSANIFVGTAVLYERQGGLRISVIRERLQDNTGIFYRLSQEARQNETEDVRADRIIAIYNK